MKIAVVGTGYVGLVAGACFSDLGNDVVCLDVDEKKIEQLRKAVIPIYEPGLDVLVARNVANKRLRFSTDTAKAIKENDVIFIAVGTPQGEDGQADLKYVMQVAHTIGDSINGKKTVVDKSTVPVGTARKVKELIEKRSYSRYPVSVVSNPEFLREGSAVKDFLEPDRVVIGSDDREATKVMLDLYKPLGCEVLVTSPESAELIKYASNSFLAAKISFINEVANLCEATGADVTEVAKGMGLDKRIGKDFLNAGCGYGGSCFPKDVKALQRISRNSGYRFRLVEQVERVNEAQKIVPFKKLKKEFHALKGRKVVVLGLSFKPNTDDLREASSVEIIKKLVNAGAQVVALDPAAQKNARNILRNIGYSDSVYDASRGADAIILATEWNEFKELDFERIGKVMKTKVLVDGRNIYDRAKMESLGFRYFGIGR